MLPASLHFISSCWERLFISSPFCPLDEAAAILRAQTRGWVRHRKYHRALWAVHMIRPVPSQAHPVTTSPETTPPLLIVCIWQLQAWMLTQQTALMNALYCAHLLNHTCKHIFKTLTKQNTYCCLWLNLCTHISRWHKHKGKKTLIKSRHRVHTADCTLHTYRSNTLCWDTSLFTCSHFCCSVTCNNVQLTVKDYKNMSCLRHAIHVQTKQGDMEASASILGIALMRADWVAEQQWSWLSQIWYALAHTLPSSSSCPAPARQKENLMNSSENSSAL